MLLNFQQIRNATRGHEMPSFVF